MTTVGIHDPTTRVHLVLSTLAGSATISVHATLPNLPGCQGIGTLTLDPEDVLALARVLTEAAVPPPPVVERRLQVCRDQETHEWFVVCPECFSVPGTWTDQPSALAAAWIHLDVEHASEREGAA